MDSGGWQAAVHRITESWMWLKWLSTHRKHQIPQRGKLLSLFELVPSSILASHWVPACDVLAAACQVASVVSDSVRPLDCSLPDFSVHGILQARILESVAISYSRGSSWLRDQTHISCISCIGRQILYHCATWEALINILSRLNVPCMSKISLKNNFSPLQAQTGFCWTLTHC